MKQLIERLLKIQETFDRRTIVAIGKVYKDHSRGLDPDPIQVETALLGLKNYYIEYIDWWAQGYGRDESFKLKMAYTKRLEEIQDSLKSGDSKDQIIALDNAINQWHIDYPVIEHLRMSLEEMGDEEFDNGGIDPKEFEELENLIEDTYSILQSLGRLPKESPYVRESSIDYPRKDLCPAIWEKENDRYIIKPEVKRIIYDNLENYIIINIREIAKEIHITGSIGTSQYLDDTDIDVHVVADSSELKNAEDVQKDIFKFFREEENTVYIDQHPIEVYLQFDAKQELLSDAVYDLVNDKWIIGPKIVSSDYDPSEDFSDVLKDVKSLAGAADIEFGELKRDTIDYSTIALAIVNLDGLAQKALLTKLKDKLYEIEDDINKLKSLKKNWIQMRRDSSKGNGKTLTWKEDNAKFKYLQRYKYMKVISKLEQILSDDKIEPEELNTIKQMLGAEHE